VRAGRPTAHGSRSRDARDIYPNTTADYEPSWSPDGKRLTFWSGVGNSHDIFTINADGTGVTDFISGPADEVSSDFSPDGSRIVFGTNKEGPYAICVVPSAGGSTTCLTSGARGDSFDARWQPLSTARTP
jgi:Tol biopolymer transport system component